MDDPAQCDASPGSFRIFRALLSTTKQAAIDRVPARDTPWITSQRLPLTHTGTELAAGKLMTSLRQNAADLGQSYEAWAIAFAGFWDAPSETAADPGSDCESWSASNGTGIAVDMMYFGVHPIGHSECSAGHVLMCAEE